MKIVCNSACVQTEAVNFTFAQKPLLCVNCYIRPNLYLVGRLGSSCRSGGRWTWPLHVVFVVFIHADASVVFDQSHLWLRVSVHVPTVKCNSAVAAVGLHVVWLLQFLVTLRFYLTTHTQRTCIARYTLRSNICLSIRLGDEWTDGDGF